jgi:UDP-N-acetylglucosamine diphosphorylase/glucosamine-1-phosphate N-acetyltransferase
MENQVSIPDLAVLILAAGKGTRMKSDLPKVLHNLGGKPLLAYSLDLAGELGSQRTIVVVGHQAERVKETFAGTPGLIYVLQEPQLGTGHAVMAAAPELKGWQGPVLILCGDVPGLKAETCRKLLARHLDNGEALTVLGMDLTDPGAYGRLVLDASDQLTRIVEFRDASDDKRAISLVNAGIYAGQAQAMLEFLPRLATDNDQKEYYLTDLVEMMHQAGLKVGYAVCPDPLEVAGVNSKEELVELESKLLPS